MGMEVIDNSLEKEPDESTTHSNCASCEISQESASGQHNTVKSSEHMDMGPEAFTVHGEYELTECTADDAVQISQDIDVGQRSEKQNIPNISTEANLPDEKVIAETSKTKDCKNPKILPRFASKDSSGSARGNCTIPQPFDLATEKCASCQSRSPGTKTDTNITVNKLSVKLIDMQSPSSTKTSQLTALFISRKPLQPDNKKHPDDEDACSVTSFVGASTKPFKCKRTTASAPVFRSTVRAERWKEYNSKLEEKHQALEAQKIQSEEKTKEEREKQLSSN
ncbi:hypothetical protein Dimus_001162 [Dionaea muscipula]